MEICIWIRLVDQNSEIPHLNCSEGIIRKICPSGPSPAGGIQTGPSPIQDSIKDKQGNILTNLEDITKEIYIQQSILNQPATLTCHHQPNHDPNCICGIIQYPCHNLNKFVLKKHGNINASIANTFNRTTYDLCLKYLSNNKALGPNNISNSILKNMPTQYHDLLFILFQQCYKQQ